MSRDDLLWRLAIAVPLSISIYAVTSHALLLAALPLSSALLPGATVLGSGIAWRTARPVPTSGATATEPSGKLWSSIDWLGPIALLLVLGTLIYGAVATPDRTWDGLVTWSPRAAQLRPPADLTAPFFADPGVFAHSLSYPVLQPLLLGACQSLVGESFGRLFSPGLFLALLVLVAAAARARGLSRRHTWLAVLAVALTPMWFARGAAAVDSGYAELFLSFTLAVAATGLLLESPLLLVCGALCLPLVKPEGALFGLLLCLISLCETPGRRLHLAAALGLGGGLALWEPLQARFLHYPSTAALIVPGTVLALLASKELLLRCFAKAKTLAAWGIGLVLISSLLTLVAPETLTGNPVGLIGSFAADLPSRFSDPSAALARVGEVLLGCVAGFLLVNKFGLLFPIVFVLLLFTPTQLVRGHRGLAGFFLGGVAMACIAIWLSPGDDLSHQFQSRFDRLLLQWTPVGWILLAAWVAKMLTGDSDS